MVNQSPGDRLARRVERRIGRIGGLLGELSGTITVTALVEGPRGIEERRAVMRTVSCDFLGHAAG